jgi:hypothetical protein
MIYAQRDRLVSERTLGQQYLFILRTLTKQARFQKKKLYTSFMDFKKTFDTVRRDLLWQVLEGLGISGRFPVTLHVPSIFSNEKTHYKVQNYSTHIKHRQNINVL